MIRPLRYPLALLLAAAALAAQAQSPPPLTPEETVKAEADYQRYCSLCHGRDREGHANDAAPSLKSKSLLETAWPRAIYEAIAYGRPGTPMGGYLVDVGGPLAREDLRLMTRWLGETGGVPAIELPDDPVAGDAARGEAVYAKNCASCHGADGKGGEGTALGNPAMLALSSDAFLRHAIVHGRQDTPMPAFAGTLADAQIDDVVAFLRSRASGWTKPAPVATPPALASMVINAGAAAPSFDLREGLYISAEQLARELDAKKAMVLLDTRVPSVWRLGHIAGAAPLPYYTAPEVMANLPRDGTWIVAYCECPRAAAESVVRKLRDQGFSNTAVLYEGIQGWISRGHPIVTGATPEGDGAAAGHAH